MYNYIMQSKNPSSADNQQERSKEFLRGYITGLVDGEGSFFVSFSIRKKMNVGIEARPSFALAQHKRNKEIIIGLQRFFQCGGVRFNNHDQTYKFEVRGLNDLVEKIFPHFEQYPLVTSKNNDFETLRDICHRMKDNQHKTVKGIKQIIHKAYMMNNIGARRYTKDQLLKVVGR